MLSKNSEVVTVYSGPIVTNIENLSPPWTPRLRVG